MMTSSPVPRAWGRFPVCATIRSVEAKGIYHNLEALGGLWGALWGAPGFSGPLTLK